MKILHIVGGGLEFGAARGACLLHEGLIKLGVDSKVLTNSQNTLRDSSVVSTLSCGRERIFNSFRIRIDRFPLIFYPRRKKILFSPAIAGYAFEKHPLYAWADIINLHWINNGFINISSISKIRKPVVWTMRDMWPMTGGCHLALSCQGYKIECGKCPQLKSNSNHDLSNFILKRKKACLLKNMVLVGISSWLTECAKESALFRNMRVQTIQNNINTEIFFPVKKENARQEFGILTRKKIILLGAQNLDEPYKGLDKFVEAVKVLDKDKYYLCLFGNFDKTRICSLGIEYRNFGFLNDNFTLRTLYSAADVFVASSIMESFGKTLAESMACGTPVVCFDATGPRDIVDHKENGYRAKPFDPGDIAKGIDWITDNPEYESLRQNAREKVLKEFDSLVTALRYKELYKEILAKW